MQIGVFDGHYGLRMEIDLCVACSGIWFDAQESFHLSPHGVVELLRLLRQANQPPKAKGTSCPRCEGQLTETWDRAHGTTFASYRCHEHGRWMTVSNLLREKGLARTPDGAELAHLRSEVDTVGCSQCGQLVELAAGTTCTACGTPIAILGGATLDEAIRLWLEDQKRKREAAVHQLERRDTRPPQETPWLATTTPSSWAMRFDPTLRGQDPVVVAAERLIKWLFGD